MELIAVHQQINDRSERLEKLCGELDKAGTDKAEAIAAYDLAIAKAMAMLSRGKISQIDGVVLPDSIPATVLSNYAKGCCHQERGDLEIATNAYKALITKIDVLSATLNAKQSIFRHLSHEAR